jgi:hypothetical protein
MAFMREIYQVGTGGGNQVYLTRRVRAAAFRRIVKVPRFRRGTFCLIFIKIGTNLIFKISFPVP